MKDDTLKMIADRLAKARAAREKITLKLKPIEEEIAQIEREALDALQKTGLEQYATSKLTLAVKTTEFAELYDEDAFFAQVKKKGWWDLIRKQCNVGAARERWEQGVTIDGVRPGKKVSLSVTTRRK